MLFIILPENLWKINILYHFSLGKSIKYIITKKKKRESICCKPTHSDNQFSFLCYSHIAIKA